MSTCQQEVSKEIFKIYNFFHQFNLSMIKYNWISWLKMGELVRYFVKEYCWVFEYLIQVTSGHVVLLLLLLL